MKSIIIPACGAALLQSCSVAQPDFTPIGDGLKAIGISLVVYGAMKALVRLMRADERKSKTESGAKSRKARASVQPGGGEG